MVWAGSPLGNSIKVVFVAPLSFSQEHLSAALYLDATGLDKGSIC